MARIIPHHLLRTALICDAVASGATGLLLAASADLLANLLGYPAGFLRGAGIVCLLFAAGVATLGTRPTLLRGAVMAVVALNTVWVLDSLVLLAVRSFSPTGLGVAFVLLQAVVVAGLAIAQYRGLKASGSEPDAARAHA